MRSLIAALLLAAGATLAEPPTDQQIDLLIGAVNSAGSDSSDWESRQNAQAEAARPLLAAMSIDETSLPQIERLIQTYTHRAVPDLCAALEHRLAVLARSPDADGALAAALRTACLPYPASQEEVSGFEKTVAAALKEAAAHPGAAAMFKNGKGGVLLQGLFQVSPESAKANSLVEAIEPFISNDLPPETTAGFASLVDIIADEKYGADSEFRERIRTKVVAALDASIAKAEADPAHAQVLEYLKGSRAFADGAYARGQLMDHPAPKVEFLWTSARQPLHSFDDLKGKVVVVDFWATWCGPCVGSFPNIRTLQERYQGYPVAIVGLTSQQGMIIDGKTHQQTPCDGDLAKEQELLGRYAKDMDMTWIVAMSKQDVFNPDFGVRGIPHVAIIDPAGKVRFNGIHPGGDPAGEAEKIDGLLREFKLDAPAGTMPKVQEPESGG